ncbi:hypothetical protein K438DRAFT_1904922 [Mycena galopus ATCC 62051]|nr:hypothetical protein K438DRAFT_1904922 [Mycena galopus ATCC 62051]
MRGCTGSHQPLPQNIAEILPQQAAPPAGSPWGYTCMAVMDGKSLTHKKCALDDCWNPLYNFKNGRFCKEHLELVNFCVQLQALGETPGPQVAHTFKAKKIYCLQKIQWACRVPLGWGKCYKSESTLQVLFFITKIWEGYPSFIGYDKACDLLQHIVTQNPDDLWIKFTEFIVDAFHYINHWATDIWTLVLTEIDEAGVVHKTRAFNTETAEQLNSWLDGFESQLQQMTDVNFDFFVHVLMLIYGEMVEKKI